MKGKTMSNKILTMNGQCPLITVIVPAYNVENDISRCVESIRRQSYDKLEIILVDDGSPDKCGAMFDDMKTLDKRIVVIHKENGGLSDARNKALDIMKGSYVTFVDGDDYIQKDYILSLYRAICNYKVEIAVCGEQRFKVDNHGKIVFIKDKKNRDKEYLFTSERGIVEFLYQRKFDTSAWGKLYSAKLFKDIRYPKGKQFEDLATTYKLFLQTPRIVFVSTPLYMYQIRMSSQMRREFNIGKTDGIQAAENVRQELYNMSLQMQKACNCRCLSMYFHVFLDIPENEYAELQNELWEKIKSNRFDILMDIRARKKTRVAVLLSYLGKKCCRYVFKKVNQK